MPRKPRIASCSGYMHVITRGVNKQQIFAEPMDYKYFLKRLREYCIDTEVKVCAFCLMNNHVHLLLRGEKDSISVLMKKIGVSYSYYFNSKYNRVGHLFQDRYRSEPVDDDRYFFTVFRYILNNPQKAGICSASKYGWSSYWEYYNPPEYMDFSHVKQFLDTGESYRRFIGTENDDSCMEYDEKHDDSWAEGIIREYVPEEKDQKGLKSLDKKERFDLLKKIHGRGVSLRQIERLTGVSRPTIKKAIADR